MLGDVLTLSEVHVGTPVDKARELNDRLLEEKNGGYEKDVFENLVFRYEEPNGMARWDSPLFTVPWDDVDPPCEAIWEAIVGSDGKAKTVRPNAATVLVCWLTILSGLLSMLAMSNVDIDANQTLRNLQVSRTTSTSWTRPHRTS